MLKHIVKNGLGAAILAAALFAILFAAAAGADAEESRQALTVTVDGVQVEMADGDTVSALTVPTEEGKTFIAWYSDSSLSDSSRLSGTDRLTAGSAYYSRMAADADAITLTVENETYKAVKGETVGSIAEPTQSGFAFAGWYSDKDITVPADAGTALTDGMTLWGKFVKDCGEIWSLKAGFRFTGSQTETLVWDFGDGTAPVTVDAQDLALDQFHTYAKTGAYDAKLTCYNSFNGGSQTVRFFHVEMMGYPYIEFESNGGTAMEKIQQTAYDVAAEKPADPVKSGSVFAGWYTDADLTERYDWSTQLVFPIKLYAKWSDEAPVYIFKIVYDGSGADSGSVADSIGTGSETERKIALAQNGFVKNTYKFKGWMVNGTLYQPGDLVTVAGDITLTAFAEWEKIAAIEPLTVTVTVDGTEKEFADGTTVADLDIPEKEGSVFAGWYKDKDLNSKAESTLILTDGMFLYSKFVKNTITITINGEETEVAEGTKVSDLAEPSAEGYEFIGWYKDAECSEPLKGSVILTAGMTVYPKMAKIEPLTTYKVTLLDKDGKVMTFFDVEAGSTFSKADAVAKVLAAGHVCKGLYTDPDMKDAFDYNTEITADISLYVDSTVSLDPNDEDNDIVPIAIAAVGILLLFVGIRIHPLVCLIGIALAAFGGFDFLGFIDF